MIAFIKDLLIEGVRIQLRILTEDMVTEKYVSWLNDPEVTKYLETKSATIEGLKKFVHEKYISDSCLFFGIFVKNSNEHIGNVKLEPIDFNKKTAVLGTLIGDKNYWGKGIASEVYRYLSRYCFEELKLETISAGIYNDAIGAIKAVQNVGFKITERHPKHVVVTLTKQDFKF